jgi:broad-specificity NMP kinase
MAMKKLNIFSIDGTLAYPSNVTDMNGQKVVLTKELLQNSMNNLNSPIFLNREHTNERVAVLHTLFYDEDEDKLKFEGVAFDEAAQNDINSGKYKISPEFHSTGDVRNPESLYLTGGALTLHPALKDTEINGRTILMSDGEAKPQVEVETPSKIDSVLESKQDLTAEFAKEHLKSQMKSYEKKIDSLTKEVDRLKAENGDIVAARDSVSEKYNNVMKMEATKIEQQLKELGYKDPAKIAQNIDAEARIEVLKELIENHVKTAPATTPVEGEIEVKKQGGVSMKDYAKANMNLPAEYLEHLQ